MTSLTEAARRALGEPADGQVPTRRPVLEPRHRRFLFSLLVLCRCLALVASALLGARGGGWLVLALASAADPGLWRRLFPLSGPVAWLLLAVQGLLLAVASWTLGVPLAATAAVVFAVATGNLSQDRRAWHQSAVLGVVMPLAYPSAPIAWLAGTGLTAVAVAVATGNFLAKEADAETENARLRSLERQVGTLRVRQAGADIDVLTGVPNRAGFYTEANRILNFSRLEFTPVGLIMLDIDHFKEVNDTWGHETGDIALRSFAATVRSAIRPRDDVLARFGGEEFIILTTGISHESDLAAFAERVRGVVEATPWRDRDGREHSLTSSLGYAVMPGGHPGGIDDLVRAADDALYVAKTGGRNRVVSGGTLGQAAG